MVCSLFPCIDYRDICCHSDIRDEFSSTYSNDVDNVYKLVVSSTRDYFDDCIDIKNLAIILTCCPWVYSTPATRHVAADASLSKLRVDASSSSSSKTNSSGSFSIFCSLWSSLIDPWSGPVTKTFLQYYTELRKPKNYSQASLTSYFPREIQSFS